MILDCINNDKIIESIIVGFILVISVIYSCINYDSDYMMAIYSYKKQFDNYQDENNINNVSISALNNQIGVPHNEIIKWNNKYRHPLIIPAFVNEEDNNNIIRPSYPRDNMKRKNKNNEAINMRSLEPKNRSDE